MNLDRIIAQVRTHCPMFAGRVAGAADFARGLETEGQLALPAAYVIPLDEDAGENGSQSGLYQNVTERIGVVVEFPNTTDRRGQSVTPLYAPTRAQLFAALLNWQIDLHDPAATRRTPGALQYGGGQLREFDRARLFYQWDFTLGTVVTDDDGWHEPSVPLAAIEERLDLSRPVDGLPEATIAVSFPQE